jgi:hypothetical protein
VILRRTAFYSDLGVALRRCGTHRGVWPTDRVFPFGANYQLLRLVVCPTGSSRGGAECFKKFVYSYNVQKLMRWTRFVAVHHNSLGSGPLDGDFLGASKSAAGQVFALAKTRWHGPRSRTWNRSTWHSREVQTVGMTSASPHFSSRPFSVSREDAVPVHSPRFFISRPRFGEGEVARYARIAARHVGSREVEHTRGFRAILLGGTFLLLQRIARQILARRYL